MFTSKTVGYLIRPTRENLIEFQSVIIRSKERQMLRFGFGAAGKFRNWRKAAQLPKGDGIF
jgi:hypothetical protein